MLERLFKIMRISQEFETELIIFGDVLEVGDCIEWAKATKRATGDRLQGLRVCDSVDDCMDYLDQVQTEYLSKAKAETNPSPRLQTLLNSYYNYCFRVFNKGFKTSEDIEQYNEALFNCLDGSKAKNFEPIEEVSEINTCYVKLIHEEFYKCFKDYKLSFIEKIRIIYNFVEYYEGREGEFLTEIGKEGVYNCYLQNKTIGELFQHFADWCDSFIYVNDDGEPLGETKPQEFADLVNWRGL